MFLSFEMFVGSFFIPMKFLALIFFIFIVGEALLLWGSSGVLVANLASDGVIFNSLNVFSVFFLILVMNYFSLLPYGFGFTSLQGTIILAWCMWVGLFFFLFFKNFQDNVAHFLPVSTPSVLIGFLIWIEVVSTLARPLALGVRLVANITAGHLLMHLSSHGLEVLSFWSFLIFPLFLCLVVLEVCVAMIQTYVFTMLLMLYTEEASGLVN